MKTQLTGTIVAALLGLSSQGLADTISVNFVDNATNQTFTGGQMIGPLSTDSAFWNQNSSPTTGNFVAGTLVGLIDGTGTPTTADVSWQCSNTWSNGDGTADDEHKLAHGYLDDYDTGGGYGVIITFSNIPYPDYRIHGLFASDFTTHVTNYAVNGTWALGGDYSTTAACYGKITDNFTNNGEYWTRIEPGVVQGNYWTVEASGPNCVITGEVRAGSARGCLTAVIIEKFIGDPGTPYCFGSSGSGNVCPCANDNDGSDPDGAGCANGTHVSGAKLYGSGEASVSNDSLLLMGTRGEPGSASLFFQAANDLDGAGFYLGDGIRCAGGNLKRLKVRINDANGDADTIGTVISARSAQLGYTIQPGDVLRYQWWCADTINPPCGMGINGSNTSNGYEIVWYP